MSVEWEGEKPTTPCEIHAKVVQVDEGASSSDDAGVSADANDAGVTVPEGEVLISQALPQKCDSDEALQFDGIPNGSHYRVVVEVFADDFAVDPFYYSGQSKSFSLKPGTTRHLSVVLRSAHTGRSGVNISFDEEQEGYISSYVVDVILNIDEKLISKTGDRTLIILANDADFKYGREDKRLSQFKLVKEGLLLEQWNLDRGRCDTPPCADDAGDFGSSRAIFVKVINEDAYAQSAIGTHEALIDFSAPSVVEYTPAVPFYVSQNQTYTVRFSVSEPLSAIRASMESIDISSGCAVDASDPLRYSCSYTAALSDGEGEKDITVDMADLAGNIGRKRFSNVVEYDFTPPVLRSTSKIDSGYAKASHTITVDLSFDEPVINVVIDWDGLDGVLSAADVDGKKFKGEYTVGQNDANGPYAIHVSAADRAGNPFNNYYMGDVIIDTDAPKIEGEISVSKNIVSLGESFQISFTLGESPEFLTVLAGLVNLSSDCSSAGSPSSLTYVCDHTATLEDGEGTKNVYVKATDFAGNRTEATVENAIIFDFTTPFLVNKSVTPILATTGNMIAVTLEYNEPVQQNVSFGWDGLDGTLVSDPNNPRKLSGEYTVKAVDENRPYTFTVSSFDLAGNPADDLPVGAVLIDTLPPDIVGDILVSKNMVMNGDTFQVTFEVSELLQSIKVLVGIFDIAEGCIPAADNARKYTCTHRVFTEEGDGAKQIAIKMTDAVGNLMTRDFSDRLTYNLSAPQLLSGNVTPNVANAEDTVTVIMEFSEEVNHVDVDWDGLPGEIIEDNDTFRRIFILHSDIEEDTKNIEHAISLVSALDAAGAVVSAPELGRVRVDTIRPEISDNGAIVDRELVNEEGSYNIEFYVSEPVETIRVRVDDVDISAGCGKLPNDEQHIVCTHSATKSEGEGAKNVYIEVSDEAGNTAGANYTDALTYDFTPPAIVNVAIGPSIATRDSLIEISFKTSEPTYNITLDGDGLDFAPPESNDTDNKNFYTSYQVTSADSQLGYTVTIVSMEDAAGNRALGVLLGDIRITDVIYVDAHPHDNQDGFSWKTAFESLYTAIRLAAPDHQIWVRKGIYKPANSDDEEPKRAATFKLKEGMQLYGGFDGDETSLEDREIDLYSPGTILDGDIGDVGDNSDNAYHVVTAGKNAALDGFVITNGNADGSLPDNVGGGILVGRTIFKISRSVVQGNNASSYGGGLYSNKAVLAVDSARFTENGAVMGGGAMYNEDSSVSINFSLFDQNIAQKDGGAMMNANSAAIVIGNSYFVSNAAKNGDGGGICNWESDIDILNSLFIANTADAGGGFNDRKDSDIVISNCTFFGNIATNRGNGIFLGNNTSDNIDIANSIFWRQTGNNTGYQIEISAIDDGIDLHHSDIFDNPDPDLVRCDTGCPASDPSFENPDYMSLAFSLRLKPDSPCIDSGDNSAIAADYFDMDNDTDYDEPTPQDVDGNPRPVDIPDKGTTSGSIVDMGAYEAQ